MSSLQWLCDKAVLHTVWYLFSCFSIRGVNLQGAKADCDCEAATQPLAPSNGGLLGVNAAAAGAAACGGASGAGWGAPKPEASDDISTDSITPELAMLPATDGPQKLFPVFRRKAEWKVCKPLVQHQSSLKCAEASSGKLHFASAHCQNASTCPDATFAEVCSLCL